MILFFLIFLNFKKLIFMWLLVYSTLLSISSNSWLGAWMGLEINLLTFITLLSNNKNILNSETSLKYFLTQAIASMNLLFIIMMMTMFMKNNMLSIMLMNSTLLLKMGASPFHWWFPMIIEKISWSNCFILMTWQKITPMILLSYMFNYKFIMISIILSMIVGTLGGLNQSSLRKLMAFSSITHMSWMLLIILINMKMWLTYFMFYSFMMLLICIMFYSLNIFYISQLFIYKTFYLTKFLIFSNMLSLGGLPPFLGFLPKWLIMMNLMNNKMNLMMLFLVIMTLITLLYYLQIIYSSFMISSFKIKWMNFLMKNKNMNHLNLLSFMSLMLLILSTIIFMN